MSYCGANLNGWFDDLINDAASVATTAIRASTPVGYGTNTPPMFPPTYGAPTTNMNLAPSAFGAMLPYLIGAGLLVYFLTRKK